MADIVLCFSGDGEALAGRLAGALARQGYRIWSEEEGVGAPITDRIAAVRAAIVLWSPAARASEWVRAEANYARGQNKLVQASLDHSPPPMPFDRTSVAPLDGWAGDPDHPGWRRILAAVQALSPPSAPPAPKPSPPARPAQRGRSGIAVAAILFLLLAAFGAFFWMRSGPPYGGEDLPAAEAPRHRPEPAEAPPAVPPVAELPMAEPPIAEPLPGPPEAVDKAPPSAAPARPAPRPSGPRINSRNSENMRLFCQRAGRGTPQCRAFQRQLRNQSR